MANLFENFDIGEMEFDSNDSIGSLLEWGSDGLIYEDTESGSDVRSEHSFQPLVEPQVEIARTLKSHWQQIPVSLNVATCADETLQAMSDETLLGMSPSLIVHLQRTAAQGGMQIISPRQVTLGGMAGRTADASRQPDMYLVGSNATRGLPWPVAAGHILAGLWRNEPLDAFPSVPAVRAKTAQTRVTPLSAAVLDPVEMAVVKSRALIDMQRRPDIGGDAEGLAGAIANSWGIAQELYDDVSGTLTEGTGNLLRYAIGPDKHYPVLHAPIQARKVISVAAMATGRDIYGEHSALDWRRLRVLSEAVFYMSARTEGWSMEDMSLTRAVGDPTASACRPGVLQFRPLPGSVWSFAPQTFALSVKPTTARSSSLVLPSRISAVLDRAVDGIAPGMVAAAATRRITYTQVSASNYVSETGEAIVAGFEHMQTTAAAFQAKGKSADSTVAGFVYQCMVGDRSGKAVEAAWVTRAAAATARDMGLSHLIDVKMARQLGSRLVLVSDDLRQKLAVEAERKGSTLEGWWDDFASRLPMELRAGEECSASWAAGIAWYLIRQPSDRWIRLSTALAGETHRALASSHLVDVRLPAGEGTTARVYEAVLVSAMRLSRSYGTYYHATADACYLMASRLARAGEAGEASMMRASGRAWDIRAAVAYTLALTSQKPSGDGGLLVQTKSVTAWVTTAPYSAYARWREAAATAGLDMTQFPSQVMGKVSHVFKGMRAPVTDSVVNSRATRYMFCPDTLYRDIEKSLLEVQATLQEVADRYEREGAPEIVASTSSGIPLAASGAVDLQQFIPRGDSLWAVVVTMEQHDAVWVVETVEEMTEDRQNEIYGGRYRDGSHLMEVVNDMLANQELGVVSETVR